MPEDTPTSTATAIPKNDGGPAFPMPVTGIPVTKDGEGGYARLDEMTPPNRPELMGMTLRDYFAAAAMGGLMSIDADYPDCREDAAETIKVQAGVIADAAYSVADAMLAERSKAK